MLRLVQLSLDGDHDDVDDGDVVDGPPDELSLVEVGAGAPHAVADLGAPQEEEELARREHVVPPIKVALQELQPVRVVDKHSLEMAIRDQSIERTRKHDVYLGYLGWVAQCPGR